MIRGRFKGLDELIRICNTLAESGETALIEITAEGQRGTLIFVEGELYAANMGKKGGTSALSEIFKLPNVSFHVRETDTPLPRKNVFISLDTLMDNIGVSKNIPRQEKNDTSPYLEVNEDFHIPESTEEIVEGPQVRKSLEVFQGLHGIEGIVHANRGRVVSIRGFGERDAKRHLSPEELRTIRQQSQDYVERVLLLMNAAFGVYTQRTTPQKILLNFPDKPRWILARGLGEDLYIVFLNPERLAFEEIRVLELIEKELLKGEI